MTSRTPIRLTPHRGPLATPSTSPESSPTLFTPPTDISYCITPTIDVSILQHRISTLTPTRRYSLPRLRRRRRRVVGLGLLGRSTRRGLIYSAYDLANALAAIITFCLLILGLLEWFSYTSELPRQPSSTSLFPLPSRTRTVPLQVNPLPYEPRDQHVAILRFLFEQIQHAKALSSLSIGLGLPLRALFEAHRATLPRIVAQFNAPESPHLRDIGVLANTTDMFDTSLLDFTSGSFIGRNFALALDELGDLISEHIISHDSPRHREHQDTRLHAIYWRTTSNLLLEYTAARPRARRLFQRIRTLRDQLSSITLDQHATESIAGRSNVSWWKNIFGHPVGPLEDEMQSFAAGLEIALYNVHQLIAYLDWITEQLARTTLEDVLRKHDRVDFSTCLRSLRELFAQSRASLPTHCPCLDDYQVLWLSRLEKVDIMVPASPTVR